MRLCTISEDYKVEQHVKDHNFRPCSILRRALLNCFPRCIISIYQSQRSRCYDKEGNFKEFYISIYTHTHADLVIVVCL